MLKRYRWRLIGLAIFGVLCVAGYLARRPLLCGAANAWIVNEPPTRSDVIVVLGGGPDTRPFEAARLYHLGIAPKILVMNPRPSSAVELGLTPSEAELTRGILLKKDVPDKDIITAPVWVTNSFDESIVVRNWAESNAAKQVVIPTDVFHTRRVRWLYGKEFKSTGIRVQVEAVPVRPYAVTNWWLHEEGIIAFQNEILKYAYYRLRY
jgi:uncharacterized SAM-binding protein YcdF (DUF218 family)